MIENIRSYTNHTMIGIVIDGVPSLIKSIDEIIHQLSIPIILHVLISVPLFYLQPSTFFLGFIVGFVFDEQTGQLVEKVNVVFAAHRPFLEKALIYVGLGFFAAFAMPVCNVTASLYYSAQWGALLYQTSKQAVPLVQQEEGEEEPEQEVDNNDAPLPVAEPVIEVQ